MMEFSDIKKLTELFNTQKKGSDSDEDDVDNVPLNQTTTPVEKKKSKKPYEKLEPGTEEKNRVVVNPDDVLLEETTNLSSSDWKKTPLWNISYKQQVTPSDVFLQVGGKTPSSASCEDMILSIDLPGESYHNMDLKVTKDRVKLTSPRFLLDIPLPHPVDPQRGNAQYDKYKEKLIITLRMDREFDYINF